MEHWHFMAVNHGQTPVRIGKDLKPSKWGTTEGY